MTLELTWPLVQTSWIFWLQSACLLSIHTLCSSYTYFFYGKQYICETMIKKSKLLGFGFLKSAALKI